MDELREQCPWDKKQTMDTLRPLTIEECYELAGAIAENDAENIREELGDVLLHIVFYSRIGHEKGWFSIKDVCVELVKKLVKRHPHIYADVEVEDENEVKKNWEQIKLEEKKNKRTLDGVPDSLPSLIKGLRLQEKAAGVGFDWNSTDSVMEKMEEELEELKEVVAINDHKKMEEEMGDFLFAVVNYCRHLNIDPDTALEKTNRKFIKRFKRMEDEVRSKKEDLKSKTLEELEDLWQKAKTN